MNIQSLLPSNDMRNQRKQAQILTEKWEPTGLLDNLNGYEKGNMAQLLENQARQLVTEANRTGTSANSEEWSGIALPLVRRVFDEISSKEFVSVQPMNLPSGLVFWLDFKFGTGQPGYNTGAGKDSQNDSVFGVTDVNKGTPATYGWSTPTEGLYGPGRFSYSLNDYSSSNLTFQATADSTHYASSSTIAGSDYNFNSEFSQSVLSVGGYSVTKVTIASASLTNPDMKGVRAFTLTGTGINDVYQEFTKVNATTGNITFLVSGSAFGTLKVNYMKQPTSITRGDFENTKTQETPIDIPEINMEFRSEDIVARTRKLKTKWSPEFAQDINAYQNIDAEAEITSMLGEIVSKEIDKEILDMLTQEAQTVDYWSKREGYEWNGSAFAQTAVNVTAYVQGTWFQTLGTKILKMSNRIHQLSMRGGANFIVCSPMVSTIFESIPGFTSGVVNGKSKYAFGVQNVGTFNGQFNVYKNPYMQENCILVGFRGSNYLETGAAYCPYIPMITSPVVLNPDTFEPTKMVLTRYAKKMLKPEYYGKIYVADLHLL
jgi:hypothetical protein